MGKLIIIRGNSGSGKTSLAKLLQRRFGRNTMLISQDVIRREMLLVRDTNNNQSIPLIKELLKYGKINSDITILEGILSSEKYKSVFEVAVEEFREDIFSYYYDIPFEETLRRHQDKNNNEFGELEMRAWWNEKDYVDILQENLIDKYQSLSDVEDMIYSEVNNKCRIQSTSTVEIEG